MRGARAEYRDIYLRAGADAPEAFATHIDRAMAGKVATAFTMKEDLGPLFRRVDRRFRVLGTAFPALFFRQPGVLVKFVRMSLALAWLQHRYPDVRIVQVVRHPCGHYASFAAMGWEPRPDLLLANEMLVADHLPGQADTLRLAETFWERAGAMWGAVNRVVHRQQQAGGGHAIVPYEWLCADPVANFKALFDWLGLPWAVEAEKVLTWVRPEDRENPYGLARDSRAQIDRWRSRVSPEDQRQCLAFAEPFGVPFYPAFDPFAARPVWPESVSNTGTSRYPAADDIHND